MIISVQKIFEKHVFQNFNQKYFVKTFNDQQSQFFNVYAKTVGRSRSPNYK